MSRFFTATVEDLRWGRQSWRVFSTLSAFAFALSFALNLL